MSARPSPSASPTPAPRPKTSPAAVEVDFEELPAVVDMLPARDPGAPLLHEHWRDNVFLETFVDDDLAGIRAARTRRRPAAAAHRAAVHVADGGPRRGRRVGPAAGAAAALHLDPDAAHRAHRPRRLPRPRPKAASASSRPMSAAASATRASCCPRKSSPASWPAISAIRCAGSRTAANSSPATPTAASTTTTSPPTPTPTARLLALDAEATVDAGAYSIYPFSACLEAAQVASILPGPYVMQAYRCRTWSAATNKPADPALSRRRARRRLLRDGADAWTPSPTKSGIEPHEVRLRNLVPRRGDAVRQHHQQAFRQRRLSRMPAPRRRRDRRARPSAPARRRSTGPHPPRPRLRDLLRAGARTAPRSMPAGASRWCRASSRRWRG